MIDITKPMRTRAGYPVRAVFVSGEELRGQVNWPKDGWLTDSWELDGRLHKEPGKTHSGDLVNV